jgi:hypothetical protein
VIRRLLTGLAIIAAAFIAVVVVAVVGFDAGSESDSGPVAGSRITGLSAPAAPAPPGVAGPVPSLARQPASGRYFGILRVRPRSRVPLFDGRAGNLIHVLGPRSEFGSAQVLGVVERRGPWFGVTTPLRPNNRLGWVRYNPRGLELYWTRYSITVRTARRRMEVRYGQSLRGRYPVTVGAAESVTPPGRYSVTDALTFGHSPDYGCCALALNGRQPNLPAGWLGGDRIAIHGAPGPVGQAASHGCIRAANATMRSLFARVPLGTPVFVTG